MKPFITLGKEKAYLPQSVDANKFEICEMSNYFLLCRKVGTRYTQATGVLLERDGNELKFHKSGSYYLQRTFPLDKSSFHKIEIDWQASSGPITITHEE
ncbi:hypothetical protein BH09BAC5_BH09BAC5_11510 [soil metagenome]